MGPLAYTLVTLGKASVLILGIVLQLAAVLTWMERRQSAAMQDRYGPDRASVAGIRLAGLLHPLADAIKMFTKEDFRPASAYPWLYGLAPLLSFLPAVLVFAVIPWGPSFDVAVGGETYRIDLLIAPVDVGVLFIFAIASLAVYGVVMAGWSSGNKWALLGSLRGSAQMISYEITLGLTVVGLLMVYATVRLDEAVAWQNGTFFGWLPRWGFFLQPFAAFAFLVAAMAETKRSPFDLPEGESELVAGYFIEYSGMRFGLFYMGEFIEVVALAALTTALFFGGHQLPWVTTEAAEVAAAPWVLIACVAVPMLVVGVFAARPAAGPGASIYTGGLPRLGERRVVKTLRAPIERLIGVAVLGAGFLTIVFSLWFAFGASHTGWLATVMRVVAFVVVFFAKVFILCWFQLAIRWTLPRFRYDQLMRLGWQMLLPLSLANIFVTGLLILLDDSMELLAGFGLALLGVMVLWGILGGRRPAAEAPHPAPAH